MLFVAGLVGVDVNKDDSALTPIFGYAITHDKRNNGFGYYAWIINDKHFIF